MRLLNLSIILTLAACGGVEPTAEEDEAIGHSESYATAYKLAGEYYYRTDNFYEDCDLATLATAAEWGVTNFKVFIGKGQTKYVRHFWWGTNAWFRWWCGGIPERSECNNPEDVDWLRIHWYADEPRFNVQCFAKCGDGTGPEDCAPY